ncbi:MAG TPA: EamA family transporter [Methylomirabilota bacterium]
MRGGLLLIGMAAAAWGTTGSVTTVLVARAGAEPLLIGAVRMAVAAAVLLAGAFTLTRRITIARADWGRCLAMGACMTAFQAAYFTAVTMTGIAVTALIAICSAPLIIAALAAGFLGERLTARVLIALALGVGGTALLVTSPGAGPSGSDGFMLGALLAAILSLPALAWTRAPLDQIALGWPWLLYIGAVATAGAYSLYTIGLRRVPASIAGIVALLEPLTATLLGMLVFGERLGAAGAVGALLLLGGVALLIGPSRAQAVPDRVLRWISGPR